MVDAAVSPRMSWFLLRLGDLDRGEEVLLTAANEQERRLTGLQVGHRAAEVRHRLDWPAIDLLDEVPGPNVLVRRGSAPGHVLHHHPLVVLVAELAGPRLVERRHLDAQLDAGGRR